MDESTHSELQLLLPWYANGTLEESERRSLDEHLAGCADCRVELERCRALGSALALATPPAPAPHPAQLARLLARIERGELDREHDADEGARASARRSWRVAATWRATPRAARWWLAVQTAALVAAAVWIGAPAPTETRQFRTLAQTEPAARRAQLRVVFSPGVGESEMRALLLEARAEIVGGPSPLGAYALALEPGVAGDSPEAVLSLLRADSRIRLAEPVTDAFDARP